jgi:tight adherence protein B
MNTMIEPLFAVAATVVVLVLVMAVRGLFDKKSEAERRRLYGSDSDSSMSLIALAEPVKEPGPLGRFDRWFEQAVARTGLEASPAGVVAAMALLATVLAAGLFYWKGAIGFAVLGVAVGIGIPFGLVVYLQGKHRATLQKQLPDALHMLAGSLRGGQTLEQGIEFCGDQGPKPLANEFASAAAQLRLGVNAETALRSAAARVRLLDFDILVSTVGLHRQIGGNLALLMDRLAASVRDRNQFRGQFLALTAQGRAVAVAIGLAAPLMLLGYTLWEPEHVQGFLTSPTGWTTLAICGALQVTGVIWLWQILRVEY